MDSTYAMRHRERAPAAHSEKSSAGKSLFRLLGVAIVLLVAFAAARTAFYGSSLSAVAPAGDIPIAAGAAERLAGSLRIPTLSHEDPAAFDAAPFRALHSYLEAAFPRAHSQLRRETVGAHSLLYTWPGSNDSLKPSASVLRFLPLQLTAQDIERIHGSNDRISVRDYERAIRIYRQLILNTAAG